jgi:hypothetical protein
MKLLTALIAGTAALAGVFLQAWIQSRREELAGKRAREDELFKLEFEKFKELEELLGLLVSASRYKKREFDVEERFDRLRHRLSLGFPDYDDLGQHLDEIWGVFMTVERAEVKAARVKELSHEVVKTCRSALMYDFPAMHSPSTEGQHVERVRRLVKRLSSTFFPALEQRAGSSEREKNL